MRELLYVYDAAEMPFDRYEDGVGFIHATGRVAVFKELLPTGEAIIREVPEWEGDEYDLPSVGREYYASDGEIVFEEYE